MSIFQRARTIAWTVFIYLTDSLACVIPKNRMGSGILVVRLDAIGDFVIWLDAAQTLSKHYQSQGKPTVLVANAAWAEWARELNFFDQVIGLDRRLFKRNPLYRLKLAYSIRRLGCRVAIQPTFSRELLMGDSVVRLSGAKDCIGFIGDHSNIGILGKKISDRWYTRLIAADAKLRMELIRNAEFVRGLTGQPFQAKVANLSTFKAMPLADSFVAQIPAGDAYYVLFPGASWSGKQWPLSNFLQVAKSLHEATGWVGVVCGGASDVELADTMCSRAAVPLLNWAGRTNLTQLAAVIANAKILLTNDTSATHIAAACGVPAVCVLGGGHYGRFMPYEVEQRDDRPLPRAVISKMACFGCNWQCIYPRQKYEPVKCIQDISVEMVWTEMQKALPFSSLLNKVG